MRWLTSRPVALIITFSTLALSLDLFGCAGADDLLPSRTPDTSFSTLEDDADADGVPDEQDACPGTAENAEVDAAGCSCAQRDADSDGVDDCTDECPQNPALAKTGGAIRFEVSFADPAGTYAAYYADLRRMVEAAGADWAENLVPLQDVSIEVELHFADIPTAYGGSAVSAFVRRENGVEVYEQGVAAEIRTGRDPNGALPDATITVGSRNLTEGRWWFDPDPYNRTTPVPADQLDAYSTILHELGHALAYNGWRDHRDGTLPGLYQSSFDAHGTFDGENFFFTGPEAVTIYGGPVPLTYGNICHLANRPPRPGEDLLDELMNGVADHRGWRRWISELDRAVLADVGLPVRAARLAGADGCDTELLGENAGRPAVTLLGPTTPLQEAGKASPVRPAPAPPHAPCACGH